MRRSLVAIGAVRVIAARRSPRARRPGQGLRRDGAQHHPLGPVRAALPIPAGADTQAKMYDGLTPLFDQVTNADLTTYFKSERFGVDTADPEHDRGRAARRRHDRARLLQRPARHRRRPTTTASGRPAGSPPRTAACCSSRRATTRASPRSTPPGSSALGLISGLQNFQPSAQTEAEVAKQSAGARGRRPRGPGRAARHRRLHLRDQRLPRVDSLVDRAVDAQRRLRPQRAQGPVRGPGRRRRGAPLAVPRRPAAAARQEEGR